jgi:hypothetical protein
MGQVLHGSATTTEAVRRAIHSDTGMIPIGRPAHAPRAARAGYRWKPLSPPRRRSPLGEYSRLNEPACAGEAGLS